MGFKSAWLPHLELLAEADKSNVRSDAGVLPEPLRQNGASILIDGKDFARPEESSGEMIALEWRDVDLAKRQICVQRSDWNGQVTTPKGGHLRYVPLTIRLAAAFRDHRHLRSPNVLCQDDGQPLTRQMRHTFCSHLAMRDAPPRAIQELAGAALKT